jgi:hypothetical protein
MGPSNQASNAEHTGGARADTPGTGPTPALYRLCDSVTEVLLYLMVVFSPWALGTTQRWSIWTMNGAAYALAGLLVVKWVVRWRAGFTPARWGSSPNHPIVRALAVLTVLILGWCLVSAANARATVNIRGLGLEYHDQYIPWLPHSYDAPSSWFAFWTYAGVAGAFWAARDWLLGKSRHERHTRRHGAPAADEGSRAEAEGPVAADAPHSEGGRLAGARTDSIALPDRLRRLLWVLCLNGAVLALEGILQRLDGTNKLLWLVQPYWNRDAESQFGPYAYRGNGAEYLNLIWPVCVGFWWTLRQRAARAGLRARAGGSPHVVLLPCAVLTAAGPFVSTSRGGAIITAGLMLVTLLILTFANRGRWLLQLGTVAAFAAALGFGVYLGWERLEARLENVLADQMSGRKEIYANAREMARDYFPLGSGPGTFGSLYRLYRGDPGQVWQAYLHNDWLETWITFGGIGFALIALALVLTAARWAIAGGLETGPVLTTFLWVAMGGALAHALYDFPFQIHSILFAFVLLACVGSIASRKP